MVFLSLEREMQQRLATAGQMTGSRRLELSFAKTILRLDDGPGGVRAMESNVPRPRSVGLSARGAQKSH
jgi:hypothetical protein